MNRDWFIGFLCALCLLSLLALSQQKSRYDNPRDVYAEFEYLYRKVQDRQFKVFKTTPNLSDLMDGEVVLVSSTTKNIVTRLSETRYKVELSSF